MVTFKLVNQTDNDVIYHYYPEGKEELGSGIIRLDLAHKTIVLEQLAENDFERVTTKEELNELRASINQLRLEEEGKELSEDEWPIATKDMVTHFYADHAIRGILETYKEGKILQSGRRVWY